MTQMSDVELIETCRKTIEYLKSLGVSSCDIMTIVGTLYIRGLVMTLPDEEALDQRLVDIKQIVTEEWEKDEQET